MRNALRKSDRTLVRLVVIIFVVARLIFIVKLSHQETGENKMFLSMRNEKELIRTLTSSYLLASLNDIAPGFFEQDTYIANNFVIVLWASR